MKMNSTIKHLLLAFTIIIGLAACKKDKKDPEPTPPVEVKAMTFTELKALSTGTSVKVPDAKKITGIVISDVAAKNIDSKTVILQEAADKPGIIITFDAAQAFAAGDQLEVTISNQTLAQVDGEIILQNVPAANAKKIGTGTIISRTTTSDLVLKNAAAWNGTLVVLGEGSFSEGAGKYKGTLTFTDENGIIKSNIATGAAFENTAYPASISTLTGIVRLNGTEVRVDLRNAADASSGVITRIITDDFSTALITNVEQDDPTNIFMTTTPVGKWLAQFSFFKTPYTADDFLQSGKKYCYMNFEKGGGGFYGKEYINPVLDHTSLKAITVKFAASKLSGDIAFYEDFPTYITPIVPFDPAKHTNEFALQVFGRDDLGSTNTWGTIGKVSFKDVGVFHTAKFALPDPTVEAYLAEINIMLIIWGAT